MTKKFESKRKKLKAIVMDKKTNLNERFNGRLHYNTGRRINNGLIRLGHNVLTISDRDIIHENKKILVENFINQPAYTMSNAIIAVYLRNIFKYKIVGLLRKGDYVGKAIFNSYGIKDINYYQNLNLEV